MKMQCKFRLILGSDRLDVAGCTADRPTMWLEEVEIDAGFTIGQQRWEKIDVAFDCVEGLNYQVLAQLVDLPRKVECFFTTAAESWDMSCDLLSVQFGDLDFGSSDPLRIVLTIQPTAVGYQQGMAGGEDYWVPMRPTGPAEALTGAQDLVIQVSTENIIRAPSRPLD
jgi:hypothetical protein